MYEAYQYFENQSQLEQTLFNPNAGTVLNYNWDGNKRRMESNGTIRTIDCIEIDDSSDGEDDKGESLGGFWFNQIRTMILDDLQ